MEENVKAVQWYGVGASVAGASHQRTNQPNQDAIDWSPREDGPAETLVLALSDGHGGAKYVRSDTGARLAVETVIDILPSFLVPFSEPSGALDLSGVNRLAEEQIPRLLVREWKERVTEHYNTHPLTNKETTHLLEREGLATVEAMRGNPVLAYGATIIAVAITPSFILYMQLGDGDILTVSEGGEVSRPLSPDARLFANETTSLCTPHAWREVRFAVHPVRAVPGEQIPALILVATDGYSNSFQDEAAFRKVGADVLTLVRAEGIETVRSSLAGWLDEASQEGSGDDITVGIICRGDAAGTIQLATLPPPVMPEVADEVGAPHGMEEREQNAQETGQPEGGKAE